MATKVLIIGATGFIGSHLLNLLEKNGENIRVLARNTKKVIQNSKTTEVLCGDLDKVETIEQALVGIEVIYYFVHAMGEIAEDFVTREINQAKNLINFLSSEQRVIYLGGIIPQGKLSKHLEARKQVGEVLRSGLAQTIEFRASIIIGNGSASFEIVRSIVNNLPIIVSASWSKAKCQPIALTDVLKYLVIASELPLEQKDQHFNIGGSDVICYDELLTKYANYKKYFRPNFYIKNFPKEIALEVLSVIAKEYFQVGKRLIESIEHETTLQDNSSADKFNIIPKNLNESFSLLNDDLISEANIKKFFETNFTKELPDYLTGESIQIFIPFIHNEFERFISERSATLKQFKISAEEFISKDSYEFRIPKVGEFKFTYNKAKSGVHVVVKPEYFFQSLGLTLLKKLLS